MSWAIFSVNGLCGDSNPTTPILSNRNAESGTAQSKEIRHELPGIGNGLSMRMENTFHFPGKSMSQFLPAKREKFSSSSATSPPESVPKSGYTSWKAYSTSHPEVWNPHC